MRAAASRRSSKRSTSGRVALTWGRTGSPTRHRRGALGDRGSEGDDGAGGVGRAQGAQRPDGGIDVGDDDGGEGLTEGGLDGRLPARLDAHEVEQRPEHAVASGEMLGPGAGVGGVEGELQASTRASRLDSASAASRQRCDARRRVVSDSVTRRSALAISSTSGPSSNSMAMQSWRWRSVDLVELGEPGGEGVATGTATQQLGLDRARWR